MSYTDKDGSIQEAHGVKDLGIIAEEALTLITAIREAVPICLDDSVMAYDEWAEEPENIAHCGLSILQLLEAAKLLQQITED